MRKIAEIVKDIREELEGAEHYAKKATQYKDDDKAMNPWYLTRQRSRHCWRWSRNENSRRNGGCSFYAYR